MPETPAAYSESVWRRAGKDTKSWLGSAVFYVFELMLTAVIAVVSDFTKLSVPLQIFVLLGSLGGGVVLAYIWYLANSGWRQRNELRCFAGSLKDENDDLRIKGNKPDLQLGIFSIGRCYYNESEILIAPKNEDGDLSISPNGAILIYANVEITNFGSPSRAELKKVFIECNGNLLQKQRMYLMAPGKNLVFPGVTTISTDDLLFPNAQPHSPIKTRLIEKGDSLIGWVLFDFEVKNIGIDAAEQILSQGSSISVKVVMASNDQNESEVKETTEY